MGPARFATERQWLSWLGARLGMSKRDLEPRVDLDALAVAMQAPWRVPRDDRSEREHLVARLALQLSLLLGNPPLQPDGRRIAFDTIDLQCRLNGAQLNLTDRERTQLAGEGGRPLATLAVLERWVDANLVVLRGREAFALQVQTAKSLPKPMGSRPLIFISIECSKLSESERRTIAEVVGEIRARLDSLVRELITSWPDQDATDEEADGLSPAALIDRVVELWPPAVDHPWWEANHVCDNRSRLWRACAHVTLAPHGGSQGTGEERGMTPVDSRHLVIQYGTDPTSLVVEGNLSGRPTTFKRLPDHTRIVEVFEEWLRAEWRLIALAWQQAEQRERQFAPLVDAFMRALEPLSEAQRLTALALVGLDQSVLPALTDPHGLAWLGPDRYGRMASALGFRASDFHAHVADASLSSDQVGALLTAVSRLRIGERESRALQREAERQKALGILRFALVWYPDWFEFREQLRADFDWPW